MKKSYFYQSRKSFLTYRVNLSQFNEDIDYTSILQHAFGYNPDSNYSHRRKYALLVYLFAKVSGFNNRHPDFLYLKKSLIAYYPISHYSSCIPYFKEHHKFLCSTSQMIDFTDNI